MQLRDLTAASPGVVEFHLREHRAELRDLAEPGDLAVGRSSRLFGKVGCLKLNALPEMNTMTDESMAFLELLQKRGGGDFLKELAQAVLHRRRVGVVIEPGQLGLHVARRINRAPRHRLASYLGLSRCY